MWLSILLFCITCVCIFPEEIPLAFVHSWTLFNSLNDSLLQFQLLPIFLFVLQPLKPVCTTRLWWALVSVWMRNNVCRYHLSIPVGSIYHPKQDASLYDCPWQHPAPYSLKIINDYQLLLQRHAHTSLQPPKSRTNKNGCCFQSRLSIPF